VLLPARLLPQPLDRRPPVLLRGLPAKPLTSPTARLHVQGASSVCCPLPLCLGRPPPLGRARPAGHHTRPPPVSSTSASTSIPCQAHAALHRPDAPDRPATTPGLCPSSASAPASIPDARPTHLCLGAPLHIWFLNLSIYEWTWMTNLSLNDKLELHLNLNDKFLCLDDKFQQIRMKLWSIWIWCSKLLLYGLFEIEIEIEIWIWMTNLYSFCF
jgi:hypothetical protein